MKKLALALSVAALSINASAFDLGSVIEKGTQVLGAQNGNGGGGAATSAALSSLSQGEVSSGLKEALNQGISTAINTLGVKNGYFGNQLVKILLPESMQNIAEVVSKAGGEKYVNDLVLAMNRAAESSVKSVAPIFGKALTNMSIEDSKKILTGGDNAATNYFKTKTESQIVQTMEPIIKKNMAQNSVYKYYDILKSNYDKLGLGSVASSGLGAVASGLTGVAIPTFPSKEELDNYMSQKAADGLFTVIGEQEQKIRDVVGARTTPLLQKVFSAI